MKAMNEKQMKELFFEGLFEERVIRHQFEKDGKYVDFQMVCTNESLNKFINKQAYKYKGKYSHDVIMSESMYWSHVAIQRFNIYDGGSWEDILDGSDKANIGKLITNIKNTVENELIRFVNDDIKFTTERDDFGKTRNVKFRIQTYSLDAVMQDGEGEETSLMNLISSEQNFWGNNGESKSNHFVTWFWENYTRFLTKSQVKLIDSLKKARHEKGNGYYSNDMRDFVGFNPKKITEYLNRISERTLKAWEKEIGEGKTFLQIEKEEEIALWTELLDHVYQEETAGMNKNVSDWIVANINNEKVMNLIYDNIYGDEIKAVVHAINNQGEQTAIPSKVIYKIVELVEKRLDKLAVMETHSVKFYKKPEEILGGWTKEKHKEHADKMKEWKQQPCKVYKLNPDGTVGEFLREETWKPFKEKKSKIKEITPTGAIIEKVITE